MDLEEFKATHLLFNPSGYGKIGVFVDFGNVRPWSKEIWKEENKYRICVEIDIQKLGHICDLIKPAEKFFYYGFFEENLEYPHYDHKNKNHRDSILRLDKARKSGFSVRTKAIKMIPHYDELGKYLGKIPKCNFDVEITMDAIKNIHNYDTAVLFSGDSDFGKLLGYLRSKKKKIIVICARKGMSRELSIVADRYIPVEALGDKVRYENHNKNTPPERAEE